MLISIPSSHVQFKLERDDDQDDTILTVEILGTYYFLEELYAKYQDEANDVKRSRAIYQEFASFLKEQSGVEETLNLTEAYLCIEAVKTAMEILKKNSEQLRSTLVSTEPSVARSEKWSPSPIPTEKERWTTSDYTSTEDSSSSTSSPLKSEPIASGTSDPRSPNLPASGCGS